MASKERNDPYDRANTDGRVTLVGAGPGAVDLITIRGQRALAEADVVVYDDLANVALMDVCPKGIEKLYVGKRAGRHGAQQAEISAILVREALKGLHVVRLKGGDPLIFGRGGEEEQVLAEAGIPFEVVPGVTSATAAGAAAGIPLTHRRHASAVVFVTGHECAGKPGDSAVDWQALARTKATLCIYMGTRRMEKIAHELRAGGLLGNTPVAVIANATLPKQCVQIGDLDSCSAIVAAVAGQPALIIVGEVVRLSELIEQAKSAVVEV
ncbi:MAG: uroporphyrinogen-III C-methyltransferase [Opitutaceae bacterium]